VSGGGGYDYFFTIEDVIGNEDARKHLFKILKV